MSFVPNAAEALPSIAILAGGLGTRLGPHTAAIPKAMVEVAGEPFVAHQLRLLAREGGREVVLCTGHLGEQIEQFVGDGARFGCRVRYSREEGPLLGTGGALRRAVPLLGDRFLVMYGDSYLPTRFLPVWLAFQRSGRTGLMTVFRNDGRWDASNVEFADGHIRQYDKERHSAAMRHIDYGLGAFAAAALSSYVPERRFDLAEVYCDLLWRGELAAYEVAERFYEIGSPAGLAETRALLADPSAGGAADRSLP
jgi:N-acetyl-alpha-D-muramate 1-phosphate uridylyltransferase